MIHKTQKSIKLINAHYSFLSISTFFNMPIEKILDHISNKKYNIENIIFTSTTIHENIHFFQNITTSYGLWKTAMLRYAGMEFFEGILKSNFNIENHNQAIDDLIGRDKKYQYNDPYYHFVTGKLFHSPIDLMENQYEYPKEAFIPLLTFLPKEQANPYVIYLGQQYALTASLLLEYQAYTQQSLFLYHDLDSIARGYDNILIPKINTKIYIKLPWTIIGHALGTDNITEVIKIFIYELVTLSLNPKWSKYTLTYFSKEYPDSISNLHIPDYEDIHPGWRFYKIAEYIADNKIQVPKSIDDISRVVDIITKGLNWLSSNEALSNFYTQLEENDSSKFIVNDLLNIKEEIKKEIGECALSYIAHINLITNRNVMKIKRGPLPDYDTTKVNSIYTAMWDIATQMYFHDVYKCPICYLEKHSSSCPIPVYFNAAKKERK